MYLVSMKYTCKKCKKKKERKAFSNHKGCKLGIDTSACKSCKRSAADWKKQPLEKRIYNRIKSRAARKNIEFDLELNDIVLPKTCPVLGQTLIYGDKDWTYSLDRIDNSKGYVKGNIQIMSNRANRLKGDFDIKEFYSMIMFLENS